MNSKNKMTSEGFTEEQALGKIKESMKKIRYGALEVIIHDSKIVQIQCTEKFRIES